MDQLMAAYEQLLAVYDVLHGMAQQNILVILIVNALTTFALAFAKAFQSRNIVLGHYWAAYVTSWGVTTLEVTNISLIVVGGWWLIFSAGFGGSLGCVVAMAMHEKYFMTRKLAEEANHEKY
jgi:pantothenate kinase